MAGEAVFGYQCVSCQRKVSSHLSRRGAVKQGEDHAAYNGGHTVFLTHRGKITLDVFWYPPHTLPEKLPGVLNAP